MIGDQQSGLLEFNTDNQVHPAGLDKPSLKSETSGIYSVVHGTDR